MKLERCLKITSGAFTLLIGLSLSSGAYAAEGSDLSPVPMGSATATFYFNQRFIPQIGQTYTLRSSRVIDSVIFQPTAVTVVDNTRYFTASESERHALEFWQSSYPGLETQGRLIIWRSNDGGQPGSRFTVAEGWTKISETPFAQPLEIGKPNQISLSAPLALSPGTYFVDLGMKLSDPKILSVHITGRESGNNTTAGTSGDRPSSCDYIRSTDSYPGGRAYRGTGQIPYTGAENNYVGFGSGFEEHKAKVQQCIKVGSFDDIFNPGDLAIDLIEAGGTTRPTQQAISSETPVVNAPQSATFGPINVKARGVSVRVDRRNSQSVVVSAYRQTKGGAPEVRCTVSGKAKSCTLVGLKPATRYFLSLSSPRGFPNASSPRLPITSNP